MLTRTQKKMYFAFYKLGLNPRPHQEEEILSYHNNPQEGRFLLFAMRMGKSAMAAAMAYGRGETTAVICPRQVVKMWKGIFETLGMDASVSTYAMCKKELGNSSYGTLILDEIHVIRSVGKKSENLKNVMSVASKTNYILGLTGTIMDMNESELYYPCKLIGLNNILPEPNIYHFYQNWCFNTSRSDDYRNWVMREEMKPIFKERLMKYASYKAMEGRPPRVFVHSYSVAKVEVLSSQVMLGVPLPLENFEEPPEGWNKAIRNQKALQLTSGFIIDQDATVHSVQDIDKCDKFVQLKYILRSNDKDSVIFYRYTEEKERLKRLLYFLGMRCFSVDEWLRQQSGEAGRKILVAHPLNGGVGLNLSSFQQLIFLTESESGILAAQAKARLSVYGQDSEEKSIIYLLPNSGAGVKLRKRLETKEKVVENFFKNQVMGRQQ